VHKIIIEKTILLEGGFTNNLADKGGATKFGISQKSYPNLDIKSLTKEKAIEIYKRDFYDKLRCDEIIDLKIRWKLFDVAVNIGKNRAVKLFQKVVEQKVDGIIGPQTIKAINNFDYNELILKIISLQMEHYINIVLIDRSQLVYLRGWRRRAFEI